MKIVKELSVAGFKEYARSIGKCSDHPMPDLIAAVEADLITEVLACYMEQAESYEDTKSRIVVKLKSGDFGIFNEWSDSSGHG